MLFHFALSNFFKTTGAKALTVGFLGLRTPEKTTNNKLKGTLVRPKLKNRLEAKPNKTRFRVLVDPKKGPNRSPHRQAELEVIFRWRTCGPSEPRGTKSKTNKNPKEDPNQKATNSKKVAKTITKTKKDNPKFKSQNITPKQSPLVLAYIRFPCHAMCPMWRWCPAREALALIQRPRMGYVNLTRGTSNCNPQASPCLIAKEKEQKYTKNKHIHHFQPTMFLLFSGLVFEASMQLVVLWP